MLFGTNEQRGVRKNANEVHNYCTAEYRQKMEVQCTVPTGIPILIDRLSTVYVPCINRISTVINSGKIAEK